MRVRYPGHHYVLEELDQKEGMHGQELQFVQRPPHHEPKPGVIIQEVLRVCIDRLQYLDRELPWFGNKAIIWHLRMAMGLLEARALIRKVEKEELAPELVKTRKADGHFLLTL